MKIIEQYRKQEIAFREEGFELCLSRFHIDFDEEVGCSYWGGWFVDTEDEDWNNPKEKLLYEDYYNFVKKCFKLAKKVD